jgi:integrase
LKSGLAAFGCRALAGRTRKGCRRSSDLTQPVDPKLYTRRIARCLKRFGKLGIAPFTLHDLRRTCRTGLARLKIEPHIAERVLNHAQERIAGTYDVYNYLDEKRAALDKWATHLRSLTFPGLEESEPRAPETKRRAPKARQAPERLVPPPRALPA